MAYKYKIKEAEGHSKYYPGGKTPGLTSDVLNTILTNIAKKELKDKENWKASDKKNTLKEDWGSSDQSAMNKSIHQDLGEPTQFPGLDPLLSAAEDAVDFYWDDWEEYNTDRDGLIQHAAHAYLRSYFPDFYKGMRAMFAESNTNSINEIESNPKDTISVDVPLFIRLLEYAREDAKTDMDLHDVAENIIKLSSEGKILTMANYDAIVSKAKEVSEASTSEFGGRAGLTKDETLKVAQRFAKIAAAVDPEKGKWDVNMSTLDEDSFDLDYNDEPYDGGSYNIYKNGNVVNMAVRSNPVIGKINDSAQTIAKGFLKMMSPSDNEVNEDGAVGSVSNAAGGYLGKYAYKLPKKQPKLEEDATKSAKPNAKNPGATLGAGPAAGKSGVSNNAYVKQFKYKVVPQTKEGTYVQKGSGMEVKKLF